MRIGTPTPKQIEAAARSLWAFHGLNGEWESGTDSAHELCREDARNALVAAAGVTPQGGTPPTDDREAIVEALVDDAWEGHDSELDREQLDLIAGTVIDAGFTRAAAVQVDEAKLAEVLVRDLTYSTGLDAQTNDVIALTQARAVAEHLRGGGQ